MSIPAAAGVEGSPGMVMISLVYTTAKPAPPHILTFLISTENPVGLFLSRGLSDSPYRVWPT